MPFKCKKYFQQHLKCKRHTDRIKEQPCSAALRYECSECGKKYSIRQSLHAHVKLKSCVVAVVEIAPSSKDEIQHQPSVKEIVDEMKQAFDKERQEMKLAFEETMKEQINKILEKHAGTSTNCNNTNIEKQQNITININSFGNENTDYLDDKSILACISHVYKSIPSILEKRHFDPNHPENHNIKITNKKLPYASVMGNNQKWKTVDRKDAIETMVLNGYNILDEKYAENKDKFSSKKQDNFEGFQSKFESEDKEMMKQIKTEVDMMVLNGL
jgi:hypothetical protein